MHRFYAMHLAPTLFGEWGRIGSPGTVKQQVFQTAELAQATFTKRLAAKARRGYQPLVHVMSEMSDICVPIMH